MVVKWWVFLAFYRSHCICDKAFYECLKKDDSWTALAVGNVYFNSDRLQCVRGLPDNLNSTSVASTIDQSGEEESEGQMKFVPFAQKW